MNPIALGRLLAGAIVATFISSIQSLSADNAEWGNSAPRIEAYANAAFNQPRFDPPAYKNALVSLSGRVTSSSGDPTDAVILLQSAQPGSNHVFSAAGRFPNLPRYMKVDPTGRFTFDRIDPAWRYYVRVLAPGFAEQVFETVDPVAGPALVLLEPLKGTAPSATQTLKGMVLDANKQPVSGGLVRIVGITRDQWIHSSATDITPYSVTDARGNFTIRATRPFEAVECAIDAPGHVTALFHGLAPGETVHTLVLGKGTAVRGRVSADGAPVTGAELRIGRMGSESGSAVWNYAAISDNEGWFTFNDIPPNRSAFLYATIESLGGRGAFPEQWIKLGTEGAVTDIGEISLEPAAMVRGRIELADGKKVPANAQAILSRSSQRAMLDSISTAINANGSFQFLNVPMESVQIRFRVPGYQIHSTDQRMMAGSSTNILVRPEAEPLAIPMHPRGPAE